MCIIDVYYFIYWFTYWLKITTLPYVKSLLLHLQHLHQFAANYNTFLYIHFRQSHFNRGPQHGSEKTFYKPLVFIKQYNDIDFEYPYLVS